MKKILLGLISVVFLMGAGLITWNLTRVVDETIQIGGSTQNVLDIERTFKEDVILTEGETLTFRYDVRKLDTANDYYLAVSLTGASVDAVTITSITPSNLQLTNEMQEVEITIGLLETATPGEFTVQFLFEAIEGVFEASAENNNESKNLIRYYSTGFESSEGFTARQNYQGTHTDEGKAPFTWTFFYGTASITGFIDGAQSFQIRYYTTTGNENNFGYGITNFKISGLREVKFSALGEDGNNVSVSISTDKTNWTDEQTFTLSTSANSFIYEVNPEDEVYVRFLIVPPAQPVSGKRITIDNVEFFTIEQPE